MRYKLTIRCSVFVGRKSVSAMKVILLALSLSLAALQVTCNEALLRVLFAEKNGLVNQMEHQIGQARSVISSTTMAEFSKFIADIQEAHKFAIFETTAFLKFFQGYSEECLAGGPNGESVEEILRTADDFLNECVIAVIAGGEEIEQRYQESIDESWTKATDTNLLFARNYFKSPEKVFTTALFAETSQSTRQNAIIWDNVESLELYELREHQPKVDLRAMNESLYKCIMDMKEVVATSIGQSFMYVAFSDADCAE